MLHGKQEADRSFIYSSCPPRREHRREPYFLRAPNQKLPTRTLPLPTRTTSMPRPRKQQKHLKNVASRRRKLKRQGEVFKAPAGSALVVRNAIRATPAAVDLMCKLLRLVAGRSVLLWVGCGCGEEILAILREVGRGVYVVALEKNEHDLGTFRSTLVAAEGVHPVDAKTDVFRLQSNGAKVRLVCVDADSLSNEQFAARAPAPLRITHIFSFAIGPLGAGRFTRAWSSSDGRRACAPSCHSTCGSRLGFCPRPSRPLAASTRQPGPPRWAARPRSLPLWRSIYLPQSHWRSEPRSGRASRTTMASRTHPRTTRSIGGGDEDLRRRFLRRREV